MLELEAEGAVQNAEGETLRDFVPRIYLQATKHAKVPPYWPGTSVAPCRKTSGPCQRLLMMPTWARQPWHAATLRHISHRTLQATHEKTLEHVPLETLMRYAIDADEAQAEVTRIDGLRAQLAKGVSFETE